ncbi:MAG: PglZ domain-containing protein [Deltaproteobacteria bacterium]|nr:PglZ domain-containing protein [Deltaproteobacteria bacterium]
MSDLLRRHLVHRLVNLFDQHRVVVWKDPSGVMGTILREVLPAGVEMPTFEGNPLSLRAQIDAEDRWLERKWLLYVPPLPEGVECEWLADYEKGFCCLPQGTLAWALDEFFHLRETPELRQALNGPAAAILALHFGQYFPGDPDILREDEISFALLRAAIKTPQADDVELILRYLASETEAARWNELGLLPMLTKVVKTRLGLRRHLTDGHAPDRGVLCRCLVASALVETGAADARPLTNHLPQEDYRPKWQQALEHGLHNPVRRPGLLAAIREALQGSDVPNSLQDPLRLAAGSALPFVDLRIERLLLDARPADNTQAPSWWQDVSAVAEARLIHPSLDAETRERWTALHAAATLLGIIRRRSEELVAYPAAVFDRLATEYVRADDGDWRIDTLYRALPQSTGQGGPEWEEALVSPAQQSYHQWVRTLTSRFTKALEVKGAYTVPGFLKQTEFWGELVAGAHRLAVLIVDALRADLACELMQMLRERGREVETRPALAQLPTRTEVGMAALLPRAQREFAVKVEDGRLVPYIGTTRLPGPVERTKYLEAVLKQAGQKVERREVDEFLRSDGALITACASSGSVPVAYTTELDEGGEIAAKVTFAVFSDVLQKCAEFIDRALTAGFNQVVVGSDHGFLVRDSQAAPGGIPGTSSAAGGLARGLRYAAGSGTVSDTLLHLSADVLRRRGDDVYVPRDTSCLSVQGGPGLFVHGGLSLQECALLFLRVTPGKGEAVRRYVPVRLQVSERETSQNFKIAVIADAVDQPLWFTARRVILRVFDAQGGVAWTCKEEKVFVPNAAGSTETLIATVPRGGVYTVALCDAETSYQIQSAQVRVEVLGEDFDFS